MDPKVKAFLDTIAWSEGTSLSPITINYGYDVIVTGVDGPSVFTDYSDHPFAQGGNVTVRAGIHPLYSTAAGRYQVLARYFAAYKTQLGLPDFSPDSQDAVAVQQIKECQALPMIESGDVTGAIAACGRIWASFPGNDYGQGGHTMAELTAKYQELLNGA